MKRSMTIGDYDDNAKYNDEEHNDDDRTVNDPRHYGADFYQPEDHGTAQVDVIAANGDAVSATSSINQSFGSRVMSPSTGIIYNDQVLMMKMVMIIMIFMMIIIMMTQ